MKPISHFAIACFILAGALVTAVPGKAQPRTEQDMEDVSLIQLIARSADYHNKTVRVIGFCTFQFEGSALYLHEEDFANSIGKNGIAIDAGWPIPREWQELSGQYVIVKAVFDSKQKGHFDGFSGTLKDIRLIMKNPQWK